MKRMNARSLLVYSATELWDILTGEFILVFDDGEFVTNDRATIYSSYVWDYHRAYPNTPLLMKHHLRGVLMGKRLSTEADLQLINNARWAVFDTYRKDPAVTGDVLDRKAYEIDNLTYNECIVRTEEYVGTIDILDFMEVLDEPEIFEVNANIQPTKESIADAYQVIDNVLRDPTRLKNNELAAQYRSKLVKPGQVLQCVGPRGALTDMDSRIFQVPITRGFAEGTRTLHDSMVESRSAAKSSFFSGEMLEQSEYFSRRLQFVAQTVQNLHPGDCGTTQYLPWKIRDAEVDEEGQQVRQSDLKLLHGKRYVDDNGVLRSITPKDRHLIGKRLNIRSVRYCAHPDPVGICSTCFGDLSVSVPEKTNIGQLCSTYMAKQSSQNILSNKHLDRNATLDKIGLNSEERMYLKVGRDNSSYLLSDNLRGKQVSMIIPSKRADSLMDIFEVANIENLPPRHIIELEEIGFHVSDGKNIDKVTVHVEVNKRMGSFTYPMLEYIRDHRWTMTSEGDYSVDMTHWKWDETFIILPQKHFNMSDHADEIANMLESRVDQMRQRDKSVDFNDLILEFYEYVNWKLEVNLALLEVILYSTMIVSAERNDYSLPKPWTEAGFGVQVKTMENRSLGVAMAYQGQLPRILAPSSYLDKNRVDHIFDGILMPNEVFRKNG